MEFNSLAFLIYFPIVTILYYLQPAKTRAAFIFAVSIFFYMCWSPVYILLLLGVIVVTYFAARFLEGRPQRLKKLTVFMVALMCVVILFIFKYYSMFMQTIAFIINSFGFGYEFDALNVLLPMGISFYTFQAVGYVVDVYRGKVAAEKNFIQYGAFITFFPQLVAGPIERSSNLLRQIKEKHEFKPDNITAGFLQMLWGYFQKIVIADRISILVSAIYDNYTDYTGAYIVVATVLFAFQVYCDFDGYTNIAIGAAKILGFELMKNFNAPYLATGIADFWDRWHISLSKWLRDYIYIPLGGNKGSKAYKCRNLMLTFLISGLWHGANWTYVVWGALHGVYRVLEELLFKAERKLSKLQTIGRVAVTFLLVDFAWLFFRVNSLTDARVMLKKVLFDFELTSLMNREMAISMGMPLADLIVLVLALMVLVASDLLKDRVRVYDIYIKWPIVIRWAFLYVAIFFILIFGYYGPAYDAAQFIYFQF